MNTSDIDRTIDWMKAYLAEWQRAAEEEGDESS